MTSRNGRRAKDLLQEDAPPATAAELARWLGRTTWFIRQEIQFGVIRNTKRHARGHREYLIPRTEAVRYLRSVGVLE